MISKTKKIRVLSLINEMVKREVKKQTLLKEEKKVKGIYGYLKLKNGKEYDLEGQIPPKFNYNDIISFGQEDIGNEAENYIKYTDGSSESLTNLKDIKLFYKKLFENKMNLKEGLKKKDIVKFTPKADNDTLSYLYVMQGMDFDNEISKSDIKKLINQSATITAIGSDICNLKFENGIELFGISTEMVQPL